MAVEDSRESERPTLLLVHGAWSAAWMWEPVLGPLREQGVSVEAIDRLPSAGEDPAQLADLSADAQRVRERTADIGGPVALCGHSYGGMVVTELADHPAVSRTIYLAAFWPAAGQSALDLAGIGNGPLPDWIVDRGDGSLMITEDVERARQALFADLDADRAAEAHRQFVLQSAASFASASTARARSHPTTYILCTEDEAIPIEAQEAMSASADSTIRLQSAHCPQLSQPRELAQALAGALVGEEVRG
jgi:pimeloyl-ACP methyl ester carboxylesterase